VKLSEGVRIALDSLRSYKLRTFLTVLGNIVAVTSVIAVVSLIDGADRYVRREVAEEGSNVVTLRRVDELAAVTNLDAFLESLHNPEITLADYRALRGAGIPGVSRVAALDRAQGRVEAGGRSLDGVQIEGWTAEYPFFLDRGGEASPDRGLAAGRHFGPFEEEHSRPVCVVGSEVVRRVLRGEHAVGRTIRVNGRHLEIVGVLAERPSVLGMNPNRTVLMPLGRHLKIFGGSGALAVRFLCDDVSGVPRVADEVRSLVRIRHRLRPADGDDFAVTSSERIVALWQSISRAIFTALILLVAISLVVGGVVIMNVMLVSVTERTREVGLRKALGARRADILGQFLAESVAISMTGGLLGTSLGFGLGGVISWVTPLPFAVEPWSVAAGLLVTFAVGIFFGLYPANRAASLDPVEALRRE
jgi:putative ABC transport system permease protein